MLVQTPQLFVSSSIFYCRPLLNGSAHPAAPAGFPKAVQPSHMPLISKFLVSLLRKVEFKKITVRKKADFGENFLNPDLFVSRIKI